MELKNKFSRLFQKDEEIIMRELFGSSIQPHHAEELHYYMKNCDSEVFSLNFERVTVIDVSFFRNLRDIMGEDYKKIKFTKLHSAFRRYAC